jgi:hypothetical protein
MKDDLIQRLQNWDGKHTDYLIAVYRDHLDEDSFFVQLVDLCLTHPETQIPATWIIKHHYDQKKSLDDDLMNHLLREGRSFSGLGNPATSSANPAQSKNGAGDRSLRRGVGQKGH